MTPINPPPAHVKVSFTSVLSVGLLALALTAIFVLILDIAMLGHG